MKYERGNMKRGYSCISGEKGLGLTLQKGKGVIRALLAKKGWA